MLVDLSIEDVKRPSDNSLGQLLHKKFIDDYVSNKLHNQLKLIWQFFEAMELIVGGLLSELLAPSLRSKLFLCVVFITRH